MCFLFLVNSIEAQVKTKIFFNEIPKSKLNIDLDIVVEKKIAAPAIFAKLLAAGFSDTENTKEYKNKFALPVKVDIDFISTANHNEVGDEIIYSLTLNAESALNITCQFEKFKLSKNAVLSIFTSYEMTDSITAKENNPNNIWATGYIRAII